MPATSSLYTLHSSALFTLKTGQHFLYSIDLVFFRFSWASILDHLVYLGLTVPPESRVVSRLRTVVSVPLLSQDTLNIR